VRFLGHMQPSGQARPHWDYAAAPALNAATTGRRKDVAVATDQMERALRTDIGCDGAARFLLARRGCGQRSRCCGSRSPVVPGRPSAEGDAGSGSYVAPRFRTPTWPGLIPSPPFVERFGQNGHGHPAQIMQSPGAACLTSCGRNAVI
jgi:hypothetical protein